MPFRLPSLETLSTFLKELLSKGLLFISIYFFTNWSASQRLDPLHLYTSWELEIPLVPAFIWVYISAYLCCLLPLFLLTPDQIKAFGRSILKCILIAGAIFFLFPAKLGFPREHFVEGYDGIYQLLYKLDQPYNLVPSLHVGLAVAMVQTVTTYVTHRGLRWALHVWVALIICSVVLVHQHHLLDVVTGFALAWGCVWHTNKKAAPESSVMARPLPGS